MGLVRYKPIREGIRELLGSDQVRADLARRAQAVARVARAAYRANPPHSGVGGRPRDRRVPVVVDSQSGDGTRVRSRAAVIARHPAALPIEADRRPLGSALDAAAD